MLDFLTAGCRYDLKRRLGIPPAVTASARETQAVAYEDLTVESYS